MLLTLIKFSKKIGLQKRHTSNNLDYNRTFFRPMNLQNNPPKMIPPTSFSNLNQTLNGSMQQSSSRHHCKQKQPGILQDLENNKKTLSNQRYLRDKRSSNEKNQEYTHSLRNLLIQKKLRRGAPFGHALSNSFGTNVLPKRGRAQLTFLKSSKMISSPRNYLDKSSSRQFKENPYYSYFQRD